MDYWSVVKREITTSLSSCYDNQTCCITLISKPNSIAIIRVDFYQYIYNIYMLLVFYCCAWTLTWYVARASGVRPWQSWVLMLPPILMICFTASISFDLTAWARGVKPVKHHNKVLKLILCLIISRYIRVKYGRYHCHIMKRRVSHLTLTEYVIKNLFIANFKKPKKEYFKQL